MTIALQLCAACGRVNYPAREVCRNCLGDRLEFVDMPGAGRLLAQTTLRASGDPVFRERLPWRIGSVLLDNGAVVIAHLGPAPDLVTPSPMSVIPAKAGTQGAAKAGEWMDSRFRGNDDIEEQVVELKTAMLDGKPVFFAEPVNQEA